METYPYSVSYINAQSTIIATVDLNDTESYSELYYELCYRNIFDSDGSELIGCVSNGTVMVSEYKWKEYGQVILTVNVYTNSTYNESYFLDCAVTQVTVASECIIVVVRGLITYCLSVSYGLISLALPLTCDNNYFHVL